jgi:Uma2 family endonuclease
MKPAALKFTYSELQALPDDRLRHELIEGDLYMTPAPGYRHQNCLGNVFVRLDAWVRQHKLGKVLIAPFDVVLSATNVVQPDLLFIASANAGRLSERGIDGPPDIVVEIRSPSTEHLDMDLKKKLYARFGVPEYWIIDPAASRVEIYRLTPDGYDLVGLYESGFTFSAPSLPGLALSVDDLFRF